MKNTIPIHNRTRNTMIILITSLGMFMSNLDISIVNIALPTMAGEFEVSVAEVSRIVLVYLLALSSLLLISGRLADTRGAEQVFKAGFWLFTLASLFCALSWSIDSLSFFRFVQGAGGAMAEATSVALILLYLPPEIRGRAIGINVLLAGIGFAAGSPAGGLLVEHLSWRWVFLVNIPIGLIVLVLSGIFLQKRPRVASELFDIPGAAFSFLGFGCLLYALNIIQSNYQSAGLAAMSFLPAVIMLSAFIFWEKRTRQPLLDLSIFSNIHLSLGLIAYMLVVLIINGFSFIFPFYFESVRSFSPDQAGLLLMILPLMTITISPFSGYFADKWRPRVLRILAMLGLALACALLMLIKADSGLPFTIAALLIMGSSVGVYYTAGISLVMSHAPEGNEGIISALIAVFGSVGAALGISLYSLVLSFQALLGRQVSSYADMTVGMVAAGFKQGALLGLGLCILGLVCALIAKEQGGCSHEKCD